MKRHAKLALTFAAAAGVSLIAASHRFGDSAHAMGLISPTGGRARHPVHLPAPRKRYTLVVTATVLPPYRGDVSVAVEGDFAPDFSVHASAPVIDVGLGRVPSFREEAFRGVEPGDRLAMWVVIRPPPNDPVCGHPRGAGSLRAEHDGRTLWFCSEVCRDSFLSEPDRPPAAGRSTERYEVVLRDAATSRVVLTIPVIVGGGEGGGRHDH